jgi:hypothetical protein
MGHFPYEKKRKEAAVMKHGHATSLGPWMQKWGIPASTRYVCSYIFPVASEFFSILN